MDLNLSQIKENLHIKGLDSPLGALDLLKSNLSLKKAHLLVTPPETLKLLKRGMGLSPFPLPVFYLPSYNKPLFFSHELRRIQWRAWARKGEGLFLAEPLSLLKKASLKKEILELRPGDRLPSLANLGYKQKDFAGEKGSFSLKGYLCDVFSPAYSQALRLELSGNQILSFHLLDKTLKKRERKLQTALLPSLRQDLNSRKRKQLSFLLKKAQIPLDEIKKVSQRKELFEWESLIDFEEATCALDFFPEPPLLWIYHLKKTEEIFKKTLKKEFLTPPFHFKNLFLEWSRIEKERLVSLGGPPSSSLSFAKTSFSYPCKNLETSDLKNPLRSLKAKHFIFISRNQKEEKEVKTLLFLSDPSLRENNFSFSNEASLIFLQGRGGRSWLNEKEEVAYLFSKDLIEKPKNSERSFELFQKQIKAFDFSQLEEGELVVHRKYGVGLFKELKTLAIGGRREDFFVLTYKKGDKLLLPAYKATEIKKYSQKTGFQFKDSFLDSLGNQKKWEQKKKKAKRHIEGLTLGLLNLYQSRKKIKRKTYKPAKESLLKFSQEFSFKETPSQKRAIEEIMEDMDKDYPMERLLCADVSFGKTEVALRASLRAIESGYQVCFLAPTTVLSLQHYENFKNRFKNWPIEVCLLNRFLKPQEKRKTYKAIREGQKDLIVATHQALNPELSFKNLSLCIIDEEHRFGVKQKEALRRFNKNLDLLSLSATPLPRTLNMSLVGLKDITVISEPPEERRPVQILTLPWKDETIKQACEFEKKRGGQILFIHNRIGELEEEASRLKTLLPGFKIKIAHGKQDAKKLETLMIQFFNKEFDLLVCTTLIESGMDIPQANTLFINKVQNLGLSQIYQLKGRVGRGKEQGYCYFLIPKTARLSFLQEERLHLLEKYKDLGSGFQLALHDLETRGAGELFGAEQSGHLTNIGQDLYFEFLNENLKKGSSHFLEPEIKLPFSAYLPEKFLPERKLRLLYYKNFSEAKTSEDLLFLEEDLRENFGTLPEEVLNLFFLVELRNLCLLLFIRELKLTNKALSLVFDERSSLSTNKILNLIEKEGWKMRGEFSLKIPLQDKEVKEQVKPLLGKLFPKK